MATKTELLKHFELANQRIRYHHDSLWEEEKHYSWWVYILLAGLIYIYLSNLEPYTR